VQPGEAVRHLDQVDVERSADLPQAVGPDRLRRQLREDDCRLAGRLVKLVAVEPGL